MGDFNAVKYLHEKVRGRPLTHQQVSEFYDFTSKAGLLDVPTSSPIQWTWHNNNMGDRRIYSRLDRAMCNLIWLSAAPTSICKVLSYVSSDHCPLLLHISPNNAGKARPFKYFSSWSQLPGYADAVSKAWMTSIQVYPLYVIDKKLSAVRNSIKIWAKKEQLFE